MSGFVRRLAGIPWRSIAGDALSRVFLVAQAYCAVHVVDQHLCSLAFVRGPSMLPAMNLAGDVVAVDRVSATLGRVAPGDVVLMISPEDPRKSVAKRVVGMEGDSVTYLVDPGSSDASKTVVVSGELVAGLGFSVRTGTCYAAAVIGFVLNWLMLLAL
jgi:inner membrane protease subunit 1